MKIKILLPVLLLSAMVANGQKDTTEVTVKVITSGSSDTLIVDSQGQQWRKTSKRRNIQTSWFDSLDFGIANFDDKTQYGSAEANAYAPGSTADWFDLKNGKSLNINLWIVSQKLNLISHVVNLKYALGLELNNYRYKNPIRYAENAPYVSWDNTPNRTYKKNKLAADYVTFPLMLNFDFSPRPRVASVDYVASETKKRMKISGRKKAEWGFSGGLSAGYLYSARNKTITSDEGKEKLKDNFGLQPWKISYVAEINLGYISLYGSIANKSMYKSGLNMTPYTVGLRF